MKMFALLQDTRAKREIVREYYNNWFNSYCEEKQLTGEVRHSLWRYYKMNPERFILNVEGGYDYV